MSHDARQIVAALDRSHIEAVAAGALNDQAFSICGNVEVTELSVVHYDPRTLGILRVSGTARSAVGGARPWSAVAKVIDQALDGPDWVSSEQELLAYTHGRFAEDDLSFRPARYLHLSRHEPSVVILWLEDLTGAGKPPFDIPQLTTMSRHLGEWNGFHARRKRALPFQLPSKRHAVRWRRSNFDAFLARFETLGDSAYMRSVYGSVPTHKAAELYHVGGQLQERAMALDGELAFGDCNVGNLFLMGDKTVAVDWASLTLDPVGVDAGCMIGSSITFGQMGAEVIAGEEELFAAYLAGLDGAGFVYDRDQVRTAYLCLFAVYLFYSAMMPVLLQVPGEFFKREFYERRYGRKWEDIPLVVHDVVQALPRYVAEMQQLNQRQA